MTLASLARFDPNMTLASLARFDSNMTLASLARFDPNMTTRIRLPRLLKKRRNNRVLAAERQGFSIIEVITVVVIIGIMALAGFAVFRGFRERTSVKVAARDVVNVMRLARRKAVTEREDYLAVYDLENEKVWVQSYSIYVNSGLNPDFGTEQALPDRAIIARVKAPVLGQGATGTGDPITTTDDYADSGYSIGYHKFSPKSTVTAGSVWLKDEGLVNFYKVTNISTTARAKIYSSW